jgi:hypothetical protein
MKAFDYEAVVFDGEVYCVECLPERYNEDRDDCFPIFADSEWDYTPVCCVCDEAHMYMNIRQDPEDDNMDGDHTSGLASAGFGTDEDYLPEGVSDE